MCKFVQHTKNTLQLLIPSTPTLSRTTPHNTLLQKNKKSQTLAQVSLTWGKEHHELRAHYIVTNTHTLGYPR